MWLRWIGFDRCVRGFVRNNYPTLRCDWFGGFARLDLTARHTDNLRLRCFSGNAPALIRTGTLGLHLYEKSHDVTTLRLASAEIISLGPTTIEFTPWTRLVSVVAGDDEWPIIIACGPTHEPPVGPCWGVVVPVGGLRSRVSGSSGLDICFYFLFLFPKMQRRKQYSIIFNCKLLI